MTTTRLRTRKGVSLSSNRWTAYATAGAATALAGAGTAEAAIHHVDVNQLFSAPPTGSGGLTAGVYSLGPGAQFTVAQFLHTPGNTSGGQINGHALFGIAAPGGVSAAFVGYTLSGSGYVSKLNAGQNINGIANFLLQGPYFDYLARHNLAGAFRTAGIGFIGFRFNTGAGQQYGWARVNMNGAPGNSFTLIDYAWGDVGDQIATGQTASVPEPAALGLLALGGVGLLAMRTRRARAAAKKD